MNQYYISWLLVLIASLNSTIGNLMLKQSRVVSSNDGFINLMFQPWFIGGLAFYGINVLLFAKALDTLPVSLAYPVLAASGFAMLIVSSSFIFHEKFNVYQWLGLALILLGVFLISKESLR